MEEIIVGQSHKLFYLAQCVHVGTKHETLLVEKYELTAFAQHDEIVVRVSSILASKGHVRIDEIDIVGRVGLFVC